MRDRRLAGEELEKMRLEKEMAENERRQLQEDRAKQFQRIKDENFHMAELRHNDISLTPSRRRSHQPPNDASLPPVSPIPLQQEREPYSPAQRKASLGVEGQESATTRFVGAGINNQDVREMLSRIHQELLLQRQDLLSPFIASTYPIANLSVLRQGALQHPSAAPHSTPGGNGSPSPAGELPSNQQFVFRSGNQPSTKRHDVADGVESPHARHNVPPCDSLPTFSMTSAWAQPLATSSYGTEGLDPISEALRRNQNRLRQLRFARHHDEILRAFVAQDSAAAIRLMDASGISSTHADLPPPSSAVFVKSHASVHHPTPRSIADIDEL